MASDLKMLSIQKKLQELSKRWKRVHKFPFLSFWEIVKCQKWEPFNQENQESREENKIEKKFHKKI